VGILFLLVASAGLYIWLGNRLRAAGQDAVLRQSNGKARKFHPVSKSNKNTRQAPADTTKPAQSPLNVDVVPIPDEDMSAIRGIGDDTFFATETFPIKKGAIFKRICAEAETVYERLTGNLQERLGDRYRLF